MGWLEGVLTGYADRHYQIQQDKMAEAQKAADREGKVFETLLNSKYKDIQDYAAAGILDLSNPRRRKGGVAGWMGDVEQTPYLDMIRRTRERIDNDPEWAQSNMRTDEDPGSLGVGQEPVGGTPPATPSVPTPAGQVAPAPPGTPPAAQPSTTPVTGGQVTPPTPAPTSTPPPAPPAAAAAAAAGGPAAEVQPPTAVAAGPGGPPAPPAGPPISMPPPAPPRGQVGDGLTGGTAQAVGLIPPPRPSRTQLPGIFPTANDIALDRARAAAAGSDLGEQDSYIRVALAQGRTRADGLRMWADAQAKGQGSGSALQNAPMEFDLQRADGTTERVLGWADRRSQQYVDVNGRPFGPDVKVTKAAPYSAITGDTWSRMAANNLGVHPGQVATNPQLAQQVEAEADRLAGGRQFRVTTERGAAAAANPLSAQGRVNQMSAWQARYNAYEAPMRLVEQNVRKMAAMYAELKKNPSNEAAWEPFRTSFVHVNENSIVMPSEFQRSDAIGSLVQRVEGRVKQWMEGGGPMPDDLIDDMMDAAVAQWDAIQGYDQNVRSQVEEALKDPALVGIRPEQIFGAPRPRLDPWTIAKPQTPQTPVTPNTAAGGGAGGAGSSAPGGTGTYWDAKQGKYVTPAPVKKN